MDVVHIVHVWVHIKSKKLY